MSDTINDLYLKYVDEIGKSLEDDRYFRYLYEMIQSGENEISQQHQILHKVVDERWLGTIEDTLDALNRIVEKPRCSIIREEEVVPVELAKKINDESVRHLSMNTQFLRSDEDEVRPNKILNVSVEETYNLYENRFIYHLIQRLVVFVDKRTDIIFWSTGDENQNTLVFKSHVDDAYESIDYRLEMKIKNLQSFSENDSDNMNVFMRIDRVRRLVSGLKNSAFCKIMHGCDRVTSPIQRTNLLTKDPYYKKCYQLWQFLDNYDEQGYFIEVENEALEFDEEYILQLYTNLITNYAVFKSITEADGRDIENTESKRKRVIKPRFDRSIQEEIVTDYNIPEVEVRQVIVEEVTQAQLEAEKKLREEIAARKEIEKSLKEAEASAHHSMIQAEYADSARYEAERLCEEAEEKAQAIEIKYGQLQEEKDGLQLKLQEKDETISAMTEQLSAETKDYFTQLKAQQEKYQQNLDEITTAHELRLSELKEEYEELHRNVEYGYMDEMYKKDISAAQEIENLQHQTESQISDMMEGYENRITKQDENYQAILEQKEALYQDSLAGLKQQFSESLSYQREQLEAEIAQTKDDCQKQLETQKAESQEAYKNLQNQSKAEIQRITLEKDSAFQTEKKAADARYEQLKFETTEAYRQLQKSSENQLIAAKDEAEKTLSQAKARYEKEQSNLQYELTKKYDDLKKADMKKMAEDERKHHEALQTCQSKAEQTEAKLSAEIQILQDNYDRMKTQFDKMEADLKAAESARNQMEATLMVERDLKDALEKKVTAQTVSEFRRALKMENKAKKAQNKLKK